MRQLQWENFTNTYTLYYKEAVVSIDVFDVDNGVCFAGGGLIVKMLKRTAQFDSKSVTAAGPPAAQNVKLDIPKKTKLFLDQTVREREVGSGGLLISCF